MTDIGHYAPKMSTMHLRCSKAIHRHFLAFINGPRREKANIVALRPAKTQTSGSLSVRGKLRLSARCSDPLPLFASQSRTECFWRRKKYQRKHTGFVTSAGASRAPTSKKNGGLLTGDTCPKLKVTLTRAVKNRAKSQFWGCFVPIFSANFRRSCSCNAQKSVSRKALNHPYRKHPELSLQRT